ncbi:glycosyl hydrolase family 2 [Micromonospora kangleipakensis]|uniref:Glycosyl hydrolase family 2 n=1 Tax=Micromonospora kangleipakensis TaxID=1077942 RepID=A0A4Q8BD29_9ACTN|nr:glycosyltransferase [Micromonospora kangleipakensis]RZU75782.1 glycosyl hydrolase family 2 [Micromonospora kangleipakensis]
MVVAARPAVSSASAHPLRPTVGGKFLSVGDQRLYIRGVTYGTFRPRNGDCEFPVPQVLETDFAAMVDNGINAVRTYTVPPRWVLDAAAAQGLRVMVGLPWEQHLTFLDDRRRAHSIEKSVRAGVRACAGHPAVLCYTIGNEIPASIVRWHGRRRVERFLERLHRAAKQEDPQGLVTYVNFPSTEYLELPFLDLVTFNVYLESQQPLEAYLARLQNLAGDRPLVMAEVGFDSRRHGTEEQARVLRWQIETAAAAGCAGAFVFAWTDEWHRGGHDIDDWDFGLTTRDRQPKPALSAVRAAFTTLPPRAAGDWPRISVVVCTYNGEPTLRDCLDGLLKLDYPDYEVIVVNDGSTDATAAIAAEYPCRVISTENRGLSAARNTGMRAATGEIVAYTDDDARPDPDWLTQLALTFLSTDHAGVGGPNIPPPGDGSVAECVANAPGGPIHVLISDREAEHIPGCNMAFRKRCLEAIGGFDVQFRTAGDDVDVCWRLQDQGWSLGFNPAAVVWHHRRNSLRAYWRQQRGYGRAEALLERKWPEKYNGPGHLSWRGRLYGLGLLHTALPVRWRVYHGTWGGGLFQRLYRPADGILASLPLMPEWNLVLAALAALAALGVVWPPLLLALPVLGVGLASLMAQAVRGAARARFPTPPRSHRAAAGLRALTAALYLAQPLARLSGRLAHGLTPWRRRGGDRVALPRTTVLALWSERWWPAAEWLEWVEERLRCAGAVFRRGGDFDRWELHIRGGLLGAARVRMAVEEHGAGRQLARYRVWPRCSGLATVLLTGFGSLAAAAAVDGAAVAAAALAAVFGAVVLRLAIECGSATVSAMRAIGVPGEPGPDHAAASRSRVVRAGEDAR